MIENNKPACQHTQGVTSAALSRFTVQLTRSNSCYFALSIVLSALHRKTKSKSHKIH